MFLKRIMSKKPKRDYVATEITAPKGTDHLGPVFAARPPALHITCEYADNEILCRELRVSLSPSDWCRFEKQEFFLQLVEWVRCLENSDTQCNAERPDKQTD